MERILVTGGGGFIGGHLARYLYLQGNYVRVADTKFDDYIQENYCHEKLKMNLRVWENCLAATEGIDQVYNLAANMGGIGFITEVGAEVMHDNILINTHMLEAARQNKVKRYLFTSPACVYPTYRQTDPNIKGLKEEDACPADPDNFNGWEKLFHIGCTISITTLILCTLYISKNKIKTTYKRYIKKTKPTLNQSNKSPTNTT